MTLVALSSHYLLPSILRSCRREFSFPLDIATFSVLHYLSFCRQTVTVDDIEQGVCRHWRRITIKNALWRLSKFGYIDQHPGKRCSRYSINSVGEGALIIINNHMQQSIKQHFRPHQ